MCWTLLLIFAAAVFCMTFFPLGRFIVKQLAYVVYCLVCGLLVIFPASLRPRNVENMKYPRFVARFLVKYIFRQKMIYHGLENIPDGPVVYMCNHQSSLDAAVMLAIPTPRTTALAKKEILMYSGPFGLACWLCGVVFIDRLSHERALATMKRVVKTMKEGNISVLIFPEGTRNRGGQLLPFKKGGFHVAVQGQLPIVPVVVSSYTSFYSLKEKRWDRGDINVTFLPPMPTEGLEGSDVTNLTEDCRTRMEEFFSKTCVGSTVQSAKDE